MFLSVIIPTRNRADLLRRTLDSMTSLDFPADSYEVLVIDNGSSDNTAEVCAEFSGRLPGFRRILDERPGLLVGRHRGLAEAKGDILAYGDDDILPFSIWLRALAEVFADPEVGIVGGKVLPKFESEPPEWFDGLWQAVPGGRMLTYYSLIDLGDEVRPISPVYVFGCNFAIRKEALLRAGGFHPDLFPNELMRYCGDGETAVAKAVETLGLATRYHPGASVHHWIGSARMTPEYIYHRAFYSGIVDSYAHVRKRGSPYSKATVFTELVDVAKQSCKSCLAFLQGNLLDRPVRQAYFRGYRDGYHFHQEEVRRDPQLLDWVLRPDYLDCVDIREQFTPKR